MPELAAGDIGSVAKLKDTHTNDTFCRRDAPGPPAADPVPRGGGDLGGGGEEAGRGGQARRRAAQAARGGPHLPLRVQLRAGPDPDPRHGRAALRDHPRPAGAEVRRARGAGPARGWPTARRSRGRPRARGSTRSRAAAGASTATAGSGWRRWPRGAGYEFVDKIVGGVIPNKYIPAVDRGIQEAAERGVVAGYPAGGFPGRVLRRVLPRRRFERDVVQDGRHPGLPERGAEVPAGAAGAADGCRRLGAGRVLGDVMGDLSARRGQILGTEEDGRLTKVRRHRARGGAVQVLDHAALDHPRPGHPSARSSTATPRRRRRWRPRWRRRTRITATRTTTTDRCWIAPW